MDIRLVALVLAVVALLIGIAAAVWAASLARRVEALSAQLDAARGQRQEERAGLLKELADLKELVERQEAGLRDVLGGLQRVESDVGELRSAQTSAPPPPPPPPLPRARPGGLEDLREQLRAAQQEPDDEDA